MEECHVKAVLSENNEIREHFTRNEGVIEINRKEPASGRGKGIPGFLKKRKTRMWVIEGGKQMSKGTFRCL
jgi:hypothetical protein